MSRSIRSNRSLDGVSRLFAAHGLRAQASCPHHQLLELLKLMSDESMMPSIDLILTYNPFLLPSFNLSRHRGSIQLGQFFASIGRKWWVSTASESFNEYSGQFARRWRNLNALARSRLSKSSQPCSSKAINSLVAQCVLWSILASNVTTGK